MKTKTSKLLDIPEQLLYDQNVIPNAKILYSEIIALSDKAGICSQTNSYFAELYKVSKRTISNWLYSLLSNGYIESDVIRDSNGTSRYIKVMRV
ncbi:helix-turn-helix domain-containing protein [Peptoniphilus sp. GNH]|nr:helix-turn-helix domain-containing protein [Peptoniphilus sp. GNH]